MSQRQSRHTIGLILSNVTNDFSGYLIEQMEELFTANGYKLLVTTTNHNIDSERDMLTMFADITDAILIISDTASYTELEASIPQDIPVIFLNRKPTGCPHTCIIENDYSAVFQAILSNSASGNDKIGLVCSNPEFWDHLFFYNHDTDNPVTLIGFSNKHTHKLSLQSFDTIAQPLQELIELAVQQTLYLINTPDTPACEYLLKGTFRAHSLDIPAYDNK